MAKGSRSLKIEMRLRDFASKNMDKIRGKVALMTARFVKGFRSIGRAITNTKGLLTAFVAVLAVRQLTRFTLGIVEAQDKLSKMARSVQSTTEELSALQFAFERSGLEIQKAEIILTGFGRARSQAFRADDADRVNDQVKAFELLGISITDLRTKGAVEIMQDMADGLEKVRSTARGQSALQALFPDNFLKLFPLLSEGGDNFRNLIDDAQRFGAVVSGSAGRAAEKFVDTMTNFKAALSGTFRELINKFLPQLQSVLERVTQSVLENKESFISLGVAVFEFLVAAGKAALGAFFATFDTINDILNRSKKEVLADIADAEERLQLLLSRPAGSLPESAFDRVIKRIKDLKEELKQFPDQEAALAKLDTAFQDLEKTVANTRIGVKKLYEPDFAVSRILRATEIYNEELIITKERLDKAAAAARTLDKITSQGRKGKGTPNLPFSAPPPASGGIVPQLAKASAKIDTSGLDKFREGIGDGLAGLQNLRDTGSDVIFTLADGLGGVFDGFRDGTLEAKDALEVFAKFMLRQLDQIVARLITATLLQRALGGLSTSLSSGGGGGNVPASAITSTSPGSGAATSSAQASVLPATVVHQNFIFPNSSTAEAKDQVQKNLDTLAFQMKEIVRRDRAGLRRDIAGVRA